MSLSRLVNDAAVALSLEKTDGWWESTYKASLLGRALGLIGRSWNSDAATKLGNLAQLGALLCIAGLMFALGLPQFASDKEGLAAIALAAVALRVVGWLLHGREQYRTCALDMVVLAFLAINIVSTAASHYLEPSIRGLAKVLVYVFTYFAFCAALQQSRKRVLATFICLLAAGLAVALYGLYQYKIGVAPLATWEDPTIEEKGTRIFSTLGNPNLLAAYLLPMISLSASLGIVSAAARRYIWCVPAFAASLIFVVATVLTGSRGGWIGLAAMGGCFLAVITASLIKQKHRLLALALWILPLGGFAVLFLKPTFHQRLMSIFAGWQHSSNAFRLNVWIASWQMFLDNWWFGIGPGNKTFVLAYGLYMRSGFDALGTYCVPLEMAVECGVLGLLIFAALVVVAVSRAHLSFWNSSSGLERWLAAGSAAALIGLMAQGLVDTVFLRPQVQMIFWLLLAAIVSLQQQKETA